MREDNEWEVPSPEAPGYKPAGYEPSGYEPPLSDLPPGAMTYALPPGTYPYSLPPGAPQPRPRSGLTWVGIGFVVVGLGISLLALLVGLMPFPYGIGLFFAAMLCLVGVPVLAGGLLMLLIAKIIDLVNAARAKREDDHNEGHE